MLSSKTFGRILLIGILALCAWALFWARDADASIKPCQSGNICIQTGFASSKPLVSGSVVTFNVKVTNKLGVSAKAVVVRYTTPRPTLTVNIKPAPNKGGPDVTVWRIGSLLPGAVWNGSVKVKILTYASKNLQNIARLSGAGFPSTTVAIGYDVNK
jgi:hypothetical protein